MNKYRFHVIGNSCIPGSPSTHGTDAFTCKAFSIVSLLAKDGHVVYHYGTDTQRKESTANFFIEVGKTSEIFSSELIAKTKDFTDPRFFTADPTYEIEKRQIDSVMKRLFLIALKDHIQANDIIIWTTGCFDLSSITSCKVVQIYAQHFGGYV